LPCGRSNRSRTERDRNIRWRGGEHSDPRGAFAQLRLRNETQLGFKQVKWLKAIELVAHYAEIGGGYGGYNEDHEFRYRQSI
jgi:hypothetical protein